MHQLAFASKHRLIFILIASFVVFVLVLASSTFAQDDDTSPDEVDTTVEALAGATGTGTPTDMPTTIPTDVPTIAPTDVPATTAPTPETTDVVSDEATDEPLPTVDEATTQPTDESTAEVPETTKTPEATVEVTPGATDEATPEATLEATPEATTEVAAEPAEPELVVSFACTPTGVEFTITNIGADMLSPLSYALVLDATATVPNEPIAASESSTGFTLLAGESLTLEGGYGSPSLTFEASVYQPETPCDPPPSEIAVEAVCAFETGVTFTVTNAGGAMIAEQEYSIVLSNGTTAAGTFLLNTDESLAIEAGYNLPVFTSGDIVSTPETTCDAPVTINGLIWNDVDGDGTHVEAENVIEGVNVTLMDAAGVVLTATTGTDGGYAFTMLPVGMYTIQSDASVVSGELEYTLALPAEGAYLVETVSGGSYPANFAYTAASTISIGGVVWSDADGDGIRTETEAGIAGAAVILTDAAGAAQSAVTAADGSYAFMATSTGTYTVTVDATTLSTDYHPSAPAEGTIVIEGAADTTNVADFGYLPVPSASVSGIVWLETSNFGVLDGGEMGITGVLVNLIDQNGTVVATAPVNAVTGAYQFSLVMAGSYTVRLDQATLFTPNGITWNSDSQLDYETPVVLASGEALTDINFGVVGTF
ncbi:MAG: hypothetical protein IT319_21345 [Anaerolineae bacterium]|nr:hypothetical protein [Anaerolineae bacterium]